MSHNEVVMNKVWVLGHGQLGAMLAHAAMPLDVDIEPVDIESGVVPDLQPDDIVTAERELWPDTPVTEALAAHPNFVNRDVFGRLADRFTQKQLMDDLSLSTSPWCLVDDALTAKEVYQRFGERALMKRRTGGYDGKGQFWLKEADNEGKGTQIPDDWRNEAIVEQGINFDEEVSLVGVRGQSGEVFFYPLALTLQVDGVLTASIAPLDRIKHLQPQAEEMLGKLMAELNYVGVMAMECFRVGDQLMINELAPRVHNTAHWTQAGASVSQFESHVRAITGLPLVQPRVKNQSVMINLLGTDYDKRWWSIPGSEPYWYGKEVRPGRKVGHINFTRDHVGHLEQPLEALRQYLPERYGQILDWALANLDDASR
jgi:5-(carboxyamino)imidazole ribonucleotide synthase